MRISKNFKLALASGKQRAGIAALALALAIAVFSVGCEESRIVFISERDGDFEIYTTLPIGADVIRLTDNESRDDSPSWSPDGERIVFSTDRTGDFEIYTMSPDGSDLRQLTDNQSDDVQPSWSPDGERIVFSTNRTGNFDIYTMSVDGSDLRQLTDNRSDDVAPSWSPDGERIVFSTNRTGNFDIYTMSVDGSDLRQLTDNRSDDVAPSWSPDGERIVFSTDRDGDFEIYTMSSDGSDARQLTDNRSDDAHPAWSPNGSRIVFSTERDGDFEIYTMSSEGSDAVRLTDIETDDEQPSWSPDGERIAFISAVSSRRAGNYEIYIMSLDDPDVIQLSDNRSDDVFPSWSPDGSRIAFSSDRDSGRFEIYTMSSDGSDVVRLTDNESDDFNPSWSPDGERIAFSSARDGDSEIYTMSRDGFDVRQLTDNETEDVFPSWSPDGERIAFVSGARFFDDSGSEIYTISSDGSNLVQLTDNESADLLPSWSPDGARIAFSSDRDGDDFEIYTMSSDGSDVIRLTNNEHDDTDPSWSLDGARIAFVSDRDSFDFEVYTMSSDGADVRRVTFNLASDRFPSWGIPTLRTREQSATAIDEEQTTALSEMSADEQSNPERSAMPSNEQPATADSGGCAPSTRFFQRDDHGDSIDRATPISFGISADGRIESEGDEDYFCVTAPENGTLTIFTDGGADTIGTLLSSSGGYIAGNDDGGSGRNFRIVEEVSQGNYYIAVRHWNSGTNAYRLSAQFVEAPTEFTLTIRVGEGGHVDGLLGRSQCNGERTCGYQVLADRGEFIINADPSSGYEFDSWRRVRGDNFSGDSSDIRITITRDTVLEVTFAQEQRPRDDHGDDRSNATRINLDSRTDGSIETAGDEDYFRVTVSQSGTLTVFTEGSTDTFGTLLNSSGANIASNDDSGSGVNFRISREVSRGTHYIAVRHYRSSGTGSYRLSAQFVSSASRDDHGDDRNSATRINLNSRTNGNIEAAGDEDYFRVTVSQSGTLTVFTNGSTDTFGALLSSSGANIASNDDSGSGVNFRISREVSRGTYYIAVRHLRSSGTGAYRLSVEFTEGAIQIFTLTIRVGEGGHVDRLLGVSQCNGERTCAYQVTSNHGEIVVDADASNGYEFERWRRISGDNFRGSGTGVDNIRITITQNTELEVTFSSQASQASGNQGSGDALKIGYLAPYTGQLARLGAEIEQGVQLAVEHINAGGGVNGQDVTYVIADSTTADTTQTIAAAQRLIEVEGVHAIVGPLSSNATLAVAEGVVADARIPQISPSATAATLSNADDNGFLFRTALSNAMEGVALADNLVEPTGVSNVGAIYFNNTHGQGLLAAFENSFAGAVSSESYELGATDFSAQLRRIAQSGVNSLIIIGSDECAEVFRQAEQGNQFEIYYFAEGCRFAPFDAAQYPALESFMGTDLTTPPANASSEAWDAAFEARFGELPANASINFWVDRARRAYDATIAIALAAERAGSLDGAAIRNRLVGVATGGGITVIPSENSIRAGLRAAANGDNVNYEGAASSVEWNSAGDITSGFVVIWEWRNGMPRTVRTVPVSLN